jgi:hypothetical protein
LKIQFHANVLGTEPDETGLSGRQNALDPGFHSDPAVPAHPDRDADGA